MRSKVLCYPALAAAALVLAANAADARLLAPTASPNKLLDPKVTVSLDAATYPPAATATLSVTENIKAARTFTVQDTSGAVWTKISDNGTNLVFTAKTTDVGGTVTVTMTRTVDDARATGSVAYDVYPTPQISVALDKTSYDRGATATMTVVDNITTARTLAVEDTSGAVWSKVSDDGTTVVFNATTTDVDGTVNVTLTRTFDGAKATDSASYQVNPAPQVDVSLDKASYDPGATATMTVTEDISVARTFAVHDTSGAAWTKVSDDGATAVFTASASGSGTVTVTMTRTRDGATATDSAAYTVSKALWAGQIPGQVILGMSCGTVCSQKASELGQPYGVHRQFKNWGDWSGVAQDIQQDHAAGRLPWVSVKSPSGASGWQGVASGSYDADIRNLANVLKANDDQPILLTFHHEPSNDGTEAQGAQWAAAYVHFNDVLDAQGALVNTSNVPIVGDWLFNPSNTSQDPANWVTNAVLTRAPFLGVDMYENASGDTFATRIPFITDWMASRGFPNKQVGIGETGSTDYYAKSTAVKWLSDSYSWALAHPDQVGVISYFNSTANSRDGVYWPLDESGSKMTTFRSFLNSALSVP